MDDRTELPNGSHVPGCRWHCLQVSAGRDSRAVLGNCTRLGAVGALYVCTQAVWVAFPLVPLACLEKFEGKVLRHTQLASSTTELPHLLGAVTIRVVSAQLTCQPSRKAKRLGHTSQQLSLRLNDVVLLEDRTLEWLPLVVPCSGNTKQLPNVNSGLVSS